MTEETRKVVKIAPIQIKVIDVEIEGVSSLLMSKQSDAVKEALRRYNKDDFKKQGKDKNKEFKQISDEDLIKAKIHYTEEGKVAFPADGFKLGMVAVAPKLGIFKNSLNSIQIIGGLIPIKFDKMKINRTMGRTAGRNKTPIEIIRPEFTNWSCKLTIRFNCEILDEEQIANILNWAGAEIGLGDWRPEHRGSYGMYKVKGT